MPKRISIVITFIIAITLILLFFLIFIPLFANEANRYISEIPNLGFITEPLLAFLSEVNAPIESIEGAQSILADISGFASDAVSFGISRIQDTASLLLAIILVPIFLFFWLWDTDSLSKGFSNIVPKRENSYQKSGMKQI